MLGKKRGSTSLSMLISFNEFAWIAFFIVCVMLGYEKLKTKKMADTANKVLDSKTFIEEKTELIFSLSNSLDSLKQTNNSLSNQYAAVVLSNASLHSQISALRDDLHSLKTQSVATKEELKTAKILITELKKPTVTEASNQNLKLNEGELRKELLGLKGNFRRVVFILDCSSSMEDSGRWSQTLKTVETWIEHLSVESCAFITFNEEIISFPSSRTFLDLTKADGRANKEALLSKLKQLRPKGYTDTFSALKMGLEYKNADTFVLFTDGLPKTPLTTKNKTKRTLDELLASWKHLTTAPINVIGVGDYFSDSSRDFLLKLASQTDGVFIGK